MEVPERGRPETTITVWALGLEELRGLNTFLNMVHHTDMESTNSSVAGDAILLLNIVLACLNAQEAEMTAYVIVDIDVKDPMTYKEYIGLAPATVEVWRRQIPGARRTDRV